MRKVLIINVEEKSYYEDNVEILGACSIGIHYHLKYKTYLKDVFDRDNIVVFSSGFLTGAYPGFSRGIAVFRSPLHGNLHFSSAGDIGEYIKKTGYDTIVIEGQSENPVIIYIYNGKVKFEECDLKQNLFDLEKYIYKRYNQAFQTRNFRVLTIGAGSKFSYFGNMISSKEEGKIGMVHSVFGRGGAGSVLFHAHRVIGMGIGGEGSFSFKPEYMNLLKEIIESTKKYRENGTFLANYLHLKENTIMFNWNIFYLNKEERLKYYRKFILDILLKGYRFHSDTCGEKCVASCKKIEKVKLDYEPATGLGPFIGIFQRNLISDLVQKADSYGFDSIYLGQALALIMEGLEKGYIDPSWLNISETPILDPEKYDKDYSLKNYNVAKTLINKIVRGDLFLLNIKEFSKTFKIQDLAVYVPYGDMNDMTPNFYWTLGLVLPILVHGKYYSDYHTIVKPPEMYAKTCFERLRNEFILDNSGICRFHRAWVEPKFESLLGKEILNESLIYLKKIYEYRKKTNILPKFLESKKAINIYERLLEENNSQWSLKEYWDIFEREYYHMIEA